MKSPRKASDEDRKIGLEVRAARETAGFTQEQAATLLGVSMQQYGKYERGVNRIATGRYQQAMAIFTAKTSQGHPGLLEDHKPYLGRPDATATKQAWERLKREVDRFFESLSER